jgi:hypothetical protein
MFDENEQEPIITPDGQNATKFHPQEAPSGKREHWQRLAGYNSGVYNGSWADQQAIRRNDNLAVFDAISGQLELTPFQKRTGRDRLSSLNVRSLGTGVETVAFAVCAITVREDGRGYYPTRKPENNDPVFVDIAHSLNLCPKEIRATMNRITQALGL